MQDLEIRQMKGRTTRLAKAAVDNFASSLRGDLITAQSPTYDTARTVWNAMIDRRPALIAECTGPADVQRCVRFAREYELLVSVQGGGHNIAGKGICDGGLAIKLGRLKEVRVDPGRRRAWVGAGATLRDVDHETQAHGLAVPLGINSTTGIAGLTLGGGFGWISRAHGLTVDNFVAADVITANGELIRASEDENPDLLWGLRGGGANLGVVTSFEFQLHPVGPQVLAGLIVHRLEDAESVMRHYRDVTATAPDEMTAWVVLRNAPPLPFLPTEIHGKGVVVLAVVYAGSPDHGERALRPLREFGKPVADVVGLQPFAAFQQAFDPLLAPGSRNYWRSHNFTSLSDALIDTLITQVHHLPTDQCEVFVGHLGGAAGRVDARGTAYPHRDATFVVNVHTRWEEPAQDRACVTWAKKTADAMAPLATGGVYVNFISEDEDRVRQAYGANFDRLAALKGIWDPNNFLSLNQNVEQKAGRARS